MARFDERSGQLYVTELGRVASHFYIRHASIVAFNEKLKPHMSEAEVWLHARARAHAPVRTALTWPCWVLKLPSCPLGALRFPCGAHNCMPC
jgi:hypothetical protein